MIKIPTAFKLLKAWPVLWIKCFVIFDFINFFSPFSSTNTVIAKKYTTLFPGKNQIFRYYFHQLNICIKNHFIKYNIIQSKLVCINVSSGVCFFFRRTPSRRITQFSCRLLNLYAFSCEFLKNGVAKTVA